MQKVSREWKNTGVLLLVYRADGLQGLRFIKIYVASHKVYGLLRAS